MEIPKDQILDMPHQQGKSDQAEQAKQELPDQVDPERDAELLRGLGVDPSALVEQFRGQSPAVG